MPLLQGQVVGVMTTYQVRLTDGTLTQVNDFTPLNMDRFMSIRAEGTMPISGKLVGFQGFEFIPNPNYVQGPTKQPVDLLEVGAKAHAMAKPRVRANEELAIETPARAGVTR